MGRRHHANSPEQRDATLDGQAPPCRFSGAERRRAGWAGAAMQILRSRATLRWMGRRHHADSPEQSDATLDGQAPPCRFSGAERRRAGWAGAAMQILRRRATPWVMGRRRRAGWPGTAMQILRSSATPWVMGRCRHADSPEQSDAMGGWLARIAVSWEESDTVFDGLAPKFRGMP
ncbi:Hypothetical predicted protein, partial [Cloeon dipterum]